MPDAVISFRVDVSQLMVLARALPAMAQDIYKEMTLAMKESGMLLDLMVQVRTPVNYGLLRSSIGFPHGFEQSGNAIDTLRGIVGASDMMSVSGESASTYVWHVEFGTKPHWAPIRPLKLWAYRKTGSSGPEGDRVAYIAQAVIAKRGTKGAHMFQRAWDEGGKDRVHKIWDKVLVRSVKRFEARCRA